MILNRLKHLLKRKQRPETIISLVLLYKSNQIDEDIFVRDISKLIKLEMDKFHSEQEKINSLSSLIIYYGLESFIYEISYIFETKYDTFFIADKVVEEVKKREGVDYYESRLQKNKREENK